MKERTSNIKSDHGQLKPNKSSRVKNFLKGIWVELTERVKWPTRKELLQYTMVVVIFVAFWALYIGIWDFLFAKGVELIVK